MKRELFYIFCISLKNVYLIECGFSYLFLHLPYYNVVLGFPHSSVSKKSACNAGDLGSIPGLGRSPLEKEMAIHSSILAWKIPWTEEPGGLQSMGLQESDTI